jgi:hypothetical protein
MKTIFVLLTCLLGIGLFARTYTARTRLLIIAVIIGMLLYSYLG